MTALKIYQKNQCLTPNGFYQVQISKIQQKVKKLYLNTSSIFYHIDDLVSLIMYSKTKLKVIGISERRIRMEDPLPPSLLFKRSILITIFMSILLLNHQKKVLFYILINHESIN